MKSSMLAILLLFYTAYSSAQQMYVDYGYVVGIELLPSHKPYHGGGGALVGGLIGYLSGEGQSGSNKALRTIGGMAVGSAIEQHGRKTSYIHRYSVDVGEGNVRYVMMDRSGYSMGDCVAIERGRSANLRRVAQVFCEQEVPSVYKEKHINNANACERAKQKVLDAEGEDAINQAAIKMKILCDD